MKAPQIIMIAWLCLTVIATGYLHDKPKTGKWNVGAALASNGTLVLLLLWGGFFS